MRPDTPGAPRHRRMPRRGVRWGRHGGPPGLVLGVRWGLPSAAALLAGLWLVVAAPAAAGHAMLSASYPADGASLAAGPRTLGLTFTEPPDLRLSSVQLLDQAGRPVHSGPLEAVPGHPLALAVPVGHLRGGSYTVSWRTISRTDGHASEGTFAFGVGAAGSATTPVAAVRTANATAPRPAAVAGRWAFALGLALLVGAAATGLVVFDRHLPGRPALLLALAVALAAAGLAAMAAAALADAGVPLGRLLGSSSGHWLAWRAAALGAAGAAAALVLARPGRTGPLVGLGAAAAAGLLVHALASHAAAPSPLRPVNVAFAWAHLVAVGVWIGGLAWLLAGLRRRGRTAAAQAAQRFSRLATAGLAVVVLTGLVRAAAELGGWDALAASGFGRVLDVKVGLFAILVLLGAVNHYRLVPSLAAGPGTRAPARRLRASVRGELGLAAAVLLAAALLAELPPAAGLRPAPARRPAPTTTELLASGSDYATSLKVTLLVTPGAVGPNRFAAAIADYDTGNPVTAERVELTGSPVDRPGMAASRLELTRAADGRWRGQGRLLSMAGRWALTTLVERPGGGVTVPLQLQVPGPAGAASQARARA